jgi:hypothetical protein
MMPGPMQRIIIGYEAQRHIIEKPSTYQKLIDMARARFSIPDGTDLSLRWFPDLGSSASIEMSTDSMYCSVGDLTYVTFSTTVYNASGDDSVAMVPLHSTGDSHLEKKRKRSSSELIRVFVKSKLSSSINPVSIRFTGSITDMMPKSSLHRQNYLASMHANHPCIPV